MKSIAKALVAIAVCISCSSVGAYAQWSKLLSAGKKVAQGAVQAATLTDDQMAQYVAEYIAESDKQNHVLADTTVLGARLKRLTTGLGDAKGVKLNFKVYDVEEVNAFACPDGSVRVYAGLMKAMTDDEVLGVIGHEIGHVANRDSKDAYKRAIMTAAIKDAGSSTNKYAALFNASQMSQITDALVNARYSQKDENEADDAGYEFLVAGGKNPAAMVSAFQKLKQMEGGSSSQASGLSTKLNQLFASHPDLDKRIKRMTQRARRDGYLK